MNVIQRFFNNLFGGKKREDEEEQQQISVQPSSRPSKSPAPNPMQSFSIPGLDIEAPQRQSLMPASLGSTNLTKAPQSQTTQELNTMADQFRMQDGDAVDETNARLRAVKSYRDKYGDTAGGQDVVNFLQGNQAALEKQSADAERRAGRWRGVNKATEIMGMLPIISSAAKPVTWGIGKAADALDLDSVADSARNVHSQMSLGMSQDEIDAIDPSQRWKLQALQGADTMLAPVDFLGLTSLAKAPLVQGVKSAAKQGVREIAEQGLNRQSRNLLRQGLGEQGKQFGIGAGIGVGMDAGTQQWLTGEINPTSFLQSALIGGGISSLTPGGSPVEYPNEVVPGVLSVNPNRLQKAQVGQPVPNQQANLNLANPGTPQSSPAVVGQPMPGQQPDLNNPNLQPLPESAPVGQPLPGQQGWLNDVPQPTEPTAMTNPGTIADIERQARNDFSTYRPLDTLFDADLRSRGDMEIDRPAFTRPLTNEAMLRSLVPEQTDPLRPRTDEPAIDPTVLAEAQRQTELAQNAPEPEPTVTQKAVQANEQLQADVAAQRAAQAEAAAAAAPVAQPVQEPVAPSAPEVVEAPAQPVATPDPVQATQGVEVAGAPAGEGGKRRIIVDTAKTGEMGKSEGKYGRGQEIERTSMEATRQRGRDEASVNSFNTLMNRIADNDAVTGSDRDAAVAMRDRFDKSSAEYKTLNTIIQSVNTEAAQTLATIERVLRRSATANQLSDRFASKVYARMGDSAETIAKADLDEVIAKNEAFTKARDDFNQSLEAFNNDPSEANVSKVVEAFNKVDEADRAAKFAEYQTASKHAKYAKGDAKKKMDLLVKELGNEANVYSMDWVDASMLSSTRVMLNNFINTLTVRGEEAVFGKAGAALARKLTGTDIGGGSRAGAKLGAQIGQKHLVSSAKLRQAASGNRLSKSVKNFTTTGNTLGERNTYAAAYSSVYDHYNAKLKRQGFTGDELKRRSLVNSLTDPDGVVDTYMNDALVANALAPTVGDRSRGKLETFLANKISEKAGGGSLARFGAKALTRVLFGFPTVVIRSAEQGSRRAALGTFSMYQAARADNPATRAKFIKQAVKEAGSGLSMYALGSYLGAQGIVAGTWPSDKDEQARWQREGIQENSIKIGGNWYNLPAALGVFALPFLLGANMGERHRRGESLVEDSTDNIVMDTAKQLIEAMPVDQLNATLRFFVDVQQDRPVDKFLARSGSGLVRAATPLGSLVNQFAKMFDPTVNDTTKGELGEQLIAKIMDGIPGLANQLPDKEVNGQVIMNPNPIARLFGAVGTEQGAGVAKTQEIAAAISETNQKLNEYGAFNDNIRNILDDETKSIFDKARAGQKIDESDMKKLVDGMVKGVTKDSDTRFLEDGDYDSNLAVLKAKRDLLAADPTTRRETLEDYDTQIKRGEIYKERQVPYELIKNYKEISLTEWQEMGDGDGVDDNPELYQALWDLDAALAEAGVSRRSSDKTKQKYYTSSGSGGGRGRGGSAASRNTVGAPANLGKVSFGNLAPRKADVVPVPVVKKIRARDLVKPRKISVSK